MRPLLLVLRALGLGDFATGVPALRALRRGFADHEIVLAAPAALEPLVAASGAVDRLLPTSAYVREPMSGLAGPRAPAIAVNLHGRGPQSHRALLALRPERLMAFAAPDFPVGPPWRADEHEVARWCRMLRWYGLDADPADLRLPVPSPRQGPIGVVILHPGASTPQRRWPAERFAAVARTLRAGGLRVVLTGTREELAIAERVARVAGLPAHDVLAARTTLAELAEITAHARLVVCGDTGVAHLATAYGTPSVVLFGPMSPRLWGPPPGARHVALWHGPDGLTEITPREVLTQAERLLSAAPEGVPDAAAPR